MSGISTKEVKKITVSKELKPGNVVAKINNISIEITKNPKDNNEEFQIIMELESKPIGGDFIGFDKVFGDPSKGQWLGQTKKIKYANWPISSIKGVSKKTGKPFEIIASSKILEFLQKLITIANKPNWLHENDGKFPSWKNMFDELNHSKILNDVYFSWCLAGTESINAKGYITYYIYLPERRDAQVPVAEAGGIVTTFDTSIHIKRDLKKFAVNDNLENGIDDSDSNVDFLDNAFTKNSNENSDEELFDLLD